MTADEVDELARRFEPLPAQDLLAWAAERFGDRIVLTCSWQFQSSVLVHMLHDLGLKVRIVELDTGLLFPETYATRDALIERYGLSVERVDPLRTVEQQAEDEGPELWLRDPDRCCALRKVAPLARALEGMDAWITGIRREQAATRANARKIEWDVARGIWKYNPLADWTEQDLWARITERDLPYHPLHDQGYSSIGCAPCTQPGSGREGRWASSEKTECGLHVIPS